MNLDITPYLVIVPGGRQPIEISNICLKKSYGGVDITFFKFYI